ncbi:hypothetical protein CK203_113325 [Vitis vinifera]|uniref:Reverse transcriptase RNase H-like domain-containing protein n=1 Tax=Vitis vinifera TaxID=29760 RepID=A0A438FDF8_VITVI|nr:hypothetical protein CK203_113325 [Vitis vinifera]
MIVSPILVPFWNSVKPRTSMRCSNKTKTFSRGPTPICLGSTHQLCPIDLTFWPSSRPVDKRLDDFIRIDRRSFRSAFEKIKQYLTQPPILSTLQPSERLYMYLAVSDWAVSAVLFRCPSCKEQKHVYYISRVMANAETRYSNIKQTVLALRSAAQKLRLYFQAHLIVVLTDQPLRSILHKSNMSGRMLQWVIELSEYGIEYQPRLSMKGQVMADLWLSLPIARSGRRIQQEEWWTLRVDGASRLSRSKVGLLPQSPIGEQLEQVIQLGFPASDNEAEYKVILSGLDLALTLSVSKLIIYNDSQLIVGHVQKEYGAKDERMSQYLTKSAGHPTAIGRANPTIAESPACNAIEESQAWMSVIKKYLRTSALPEKSKHAHKIHVQADHFTLIGECLYKRSSTSPYLICFDHSKV